jgi:hypothetical protein
VLLFNPKPDHLPMFPAISGVFSESLDHRLANPLLIFARERCILCRLLDMSQ